MNAVNRFIAGLLLWLLISAGLTSWQGHLGGLLAGGVVTFAYAYAPPGRRRTLVQAAACAVLLAILVITAVGKVSELTGGAA
jgi:membrane associated rhomboid family serine protease